MNGHYQLLKKYVFKPRLESKIVPLNWKNNCCEAMNNTLKLSVNWKPCKLA